MTHVSELGIVNDRATRTAAMSKQEIRAAATRGGLWTATNVAVSVPIAVTANTVIARALGVVDYGRLAIITAILGIASGVTEFGVSDGAIQWGSKLHARGNGEAARALLQKTTGFRILVQVPIMLGLIGLLAHDEPPLVIWALASGVVTSAVFGAASHSYAVEHRSADGAKIAMLGNAFAQLATAVVAVLTHRPMAAWAARNAAWAVTAPLNLLSVPRKQRLRLITPRIPRNMPRGLWRYALLTAATGLLGTLVFSRSEVFILGAFHRSAAAGAFALAFGLAQQITAPVDALATPLAPAVSALLDAHPNQAGAALLRTLRLMSLLSAVFLVATVPLVYLAIPLLYGRGFSLAAIAFVPLAITSFAQSVMNPVFAFTRARQRTDIVLRITVLALLVDCFVAGAGIPLVPLWGAVAANMAGFVAVLLGGLSTECRALGVSGKKCLSAFLPLGVSASSVVGAIAVAGSLDLRGPRTLVVVVIPAALWFAYSRRYTSMAESAEIRAPFARLPRSLRAPINLCLTAILGPASPRSVGAPR